jgi:hypothetical protein
VKSTPSRAQSRRNDSLDVRVAHRWTPKTVVGSRIVGAHDTLDLELMRCRPCLHVLLPRSKRAVGQLPYPDLDLLADRQPPPWIASRRPERSATTKLWAALFSCTTMPLIVTSLGDATLQLPARARKREARRCRPRNACGSVHLEILLLGRGNDGLSCLRLSRGAVDGMSDGRFGVRSSARSR